MLAVGGGGCGWLVGCPAGSDIILYSYYIVI